MREAPHDRALVSDVVNLVTTFVSLDQSAQRDILSRTHLNMYSGFFDRGSKYTFSSSYAFPSLFNCMCPGLSTSQIIEQNGTEAH